MDFPRATRTSAFLAGASLAFLAFAASVLKQRGVIDVDADSPQVFPFVAAYFFITTLFFVIDVRSIFPAELKTRVPGIYFPTNREGWHFMLQVWGRMIVWFLGAAGTAALVSAAHWLVK